MSVNRVVFPLVAVLLTFTASSVAQTFEQFGAWQYTKSGATEAAYTESTDADRTFSLSVRCESGTPVVNLEFLVASPGDDIGLNPDRFAPDGQVRARVDGEPAEAINWSFSTASEVFVNDSPTRFLSEIYDASTASIRVQDANGRQVGAYSFDLRGVEAALDALTCYRDGE